MLEYNQFKFIKLVNNSTFNRGAAYNEIQRTIHKKKEMQNKYLVLMDADICVPRKLWKPILLNLPTTRYSLLSLLDRCVLDEPNSLKYNKYRVIVEPKKYVTTLGFFQLYKIHEHSPVYPINYPTAAKSDKVFGNNFHRSNRTWINGRVFHMGKTGRWSGQLRLQKNWSKIETQLSWNNC